MITTQAKNLHHPLQTLVGLFITLITCVYTACSNSEPVGSNDESGSIADWDSPEASNASPSGVIDYLPLDDTEYPYAGIPRIVIETENHQTIKERETEIPAKLQIWGENKPESEIMELTIRGRGNTSWDNMPKKSYKIEFTDKQTMFGMPQNRDWALVANYADKTLMKNYLMYHLSAKIGSYYTPRCEFVELYLNSEYLGVYLFTETIKIARNRINLPQNNESYIVEFDTKYHTDEQIFFSKIIKNDSVGKAFHIHEPKRATKEALLKIEQHITNFETYLKKIETHQENHINQWIDIDAYIKHYWIQEFSKNPDAIFYSSVFFSWKTNDVIKIGPVWDFDLSFGEHLDSSKNTPEKWYIKGAYWNLYVFKDTQMETERKNFWKQNRNLFSSTTSAIDSVHTILHKAAQNNFKRWNVLSSTKSTFHHHAYNSYDEAINDLKKWMVQRFNWIDTELGKTI